MVQEVITSVVALVVMIGGCWLWAVIDEKRAARKRAKRDQP